MLKLKKKFGIAKTFNYLSLKFTEQKSRVKIDCVQYVC